MHELICIAAGRGKLTFPLKCRRERSLMRPAFPDLVHHDSRAFSASVFPTTPEKCTWACEKPRKWRGAMRGGCAACEELSLRSGNMLVILYSRDPAGLLYIHQE